MKSALFYYANIFLTLGLFAGHYLVAQDLSAFKVIDYQSVGLAPAGFAKRGGCLVDIDRNGWPDIYTLKYN